MMDPISHRLHKLSLAHRLPLRQSLLGIPGTCSAFKSLVVWGKELGKREKGKAYSIWEAVHGFLLFTESFAGALIVSSEAFLAIWTCRQVVLIELASVVPVYSGAASLLCTPLRWFRLLDWAVQSKVWVCNYLPIHLLLPVLRTRRKLADAFQTCSN